jgi:quercetin dioxygenase-like cupin family protein
MADQPRESSLPEDRAGASPARAPRPLAAPVLTFDFTEEADKLRKEGPWLQHGRNAVTLVKYADFRVVFMLMKPGTRLQEHHASGRLSVQTLSGHVRLHLKERTIDLPAGNLLALEREVVHDVEAVAESAVLLTIAWPGEVTGR